MDEIQTQAAEWLAKLDAGTADAAAFEAWRAQDPRHAVTYAQALDAFARMDRLAADQIVAEEIPVAAPAPQQDAPIAKHVAPGALQNGPSRRQLMRAAAAIVPAAFVGTLLWAGFSSPAQAATGPGEQRHVDVTPGVSVLLNAQSRIAWAVGPDRCELWLHEGEAAIHVALAYPGEVTLSGSDWHRLLDAGEYNVRMADSAAGGSAGGAQLLVLRGRARSADGVRNGGRGTRDSVTSGQLAIMVPGNHRVEAAPANITINARAWPEGKIEFNGETLEQAVAEYNRHLERQLVVPDTDVKALRIGGRYDLFRPEAFIDSIEASFDLVARDEGNSIMLEKVYGKK